ncbi:MAG: bifunctional demethylmenaquinone methyltransferase/2-methoxy-6-polyprenyl-1,4-benzoquinol methylase UbiE [Duncaniella sp.]|nr:bifunctional demethylmenaquinone methyltransferase/2-methoxy-6-polyprenyl-1,4-benzoquinol methylase UbiE [Duncaniella sp.]
MSNDVENITPFEGDQRGKTEQVRDMFDSIAPDYDFMNRAMTFGIDRWWRRKAVGMLREVPHDDILDIATGTGDLAITLARRLSPRQVTGIDLSAEMVSIGRRKISKEGLADTVTLGIADCLALPFADGSFDAVTCAYGVRNFADLLAGLVEMCRVLRPGGMVMILELTTPRNSLVRPLYDIYAGRIIPAIGRKVSGSDAAYSYLPASIAAVPQGPAMEALLAEAGFTDPSTRSLTFGTCAIYTARKPM